MTERKGMIGVRIRADDKRNSSSGKRGPERDYRSSALKPDIKLKDYFSHPFIHWTANDKLLERKVNQITTLKQKRKVISNKRF